MTTFLRLIADDDKEENLSLVLQSLRSSEFDQRVYQVNPEAFRSIPGTPFAYWVSDDLRSLFESLPAFESEGRSVRVGLQTSDDFRFVRAWWEVKQKQDGWTYFAKGGKYSPFYADIYLVVNWSGDGREIKNFVDLKSGKLKSRPQNTDYYGLSGLTWPTRAKRFAPQALGVGCMFSQRGFFAYFPAGDQTAALALFNSSAFDYVFKTALGRFGYPEFLVGILQKMPWANLDERTEALLEGLARRAWSLKRSLDSINETSHAFLLPTTLRSRIGRYNPLAIEDELAQIQSEIDSIAFELYEFSEADRLAVSSYGNSLAESSDDDAVELEEARDDEDAAEASIPPGDALLSWALGIVFGRFDWRIASGEREAPAEPDPFDPLPSKSPGMLPDDAAPFHAHAGILVDDEGHAHDLALLLEKLLEKVDAPVQANIRRWLRREFFPFHLKLYSKSKRKAPIYWPLSTLSGAYTLWLYYPDLTSQTLFSAVNDFIEPKLQQVHGDLESLRGKGNARSKQEEKQLEVASDLSQELADLRDALLAIAPKFSPNHDDGVQITAAPLWQLFRHKPWQKALKDTWDKLEQGDYDWAHLAMNYWPERVLRKCHQDRSLAIAHDVEDTFWHEAEVPVIRGKKTTGETKLEWQSKKMTDSELDALIQVKIMEKKA